MGCWLTLKHNWRNCQWHAFLHAQKAFECHPTRVLSIKQHLNYGGVDSQFPWYPLPSVVKSSFIAAPSICRIPASISALGSSLQSECAVSAIPSAARSDALLTAFYTLWAASQWHFPLRLSTCFRVAGA